MKTWAIGLAVGLLFPLVGQAASLRMDGEQVWLEAKNDSLASVLALFQERGVEVLLDPAAGGCRVSGSWENVEADKVLDQVIRPNNYVTSWQKISGPLGSFFQLSGIRVFSSDQTGTPMPLAEKQKTLDVFEPADGSQPYIAGEIMVGFKEGSSSEDLKALLQKLGGTVVGVINPPGIYRIKIGEHLSVEAATAIALAHEGVAATEPNYAFKPISSPSVPGAGLPGNMNLQLQPGETAIAVFDSGLDPQYADQPFIRGTYNAIDPETPISDPNGHGTLMSLIAAGVVSPNGAPVAETGNPVLSVRAFDENGYTSSEVLMNALNFAKDSGVEVINMSWGSETDSAFIRAAMDFASQNGITLVAAAGNEPSGRPVYPSAYPNVICVGGTNPDGSPWPQSNYGDWIDETTYAYAVLNGQTSVGTSISSAYTAYLKAVEK